MKNQGFTLIELLVVVLIIGILAAVALPKYQKSVLSSKLTQYLVYVDALRKGANLYYLANGQTPYDIRDIDLDLSSFAVELGPSRKITNESRAVAAFFEGDFECAFSRDALACIGPDFYLLSVHSWSDTQYQQLSGIVCFGNDNKYAEEICKSKSDGVSVMYNNNLKSNGYRIKID